MIPWGRRKTDHFFGYGSAVGPSLPRPDCAGGVVDLHMRLQVVAIYVEAEGLAVVLDRLRLKAHATADKLLLVIHGRDAIEHVVARVADVARICSSNGSMPVSLR